MTASHHRIEFPLPVYFKHPRTGVVVEVDREGVTTFSGNGNHGHFRSFAKMVDPETGEGWNAASEILTLTNAKWRRV